MEGYLYPSCQNYVHSSFRSREMEAETAVSCDKTPPPPAHVGVTLVCSYGGRFLPRPHESQLSYVGGETNIIIVDRSARFSFIVLKLAAMYGVASPNDICIKYQIPGEDLDFLISVTNDEDLEYMMDEYDRLLRSAPKPAARLRLFIFPAHHSMASTAAAKFGEKTDRQSFVEGLNFIPLQLVPALDQNQMKFSTTQAVILDLLTGDTVPSSLPETPIIESFSSEAPPAISDLQKEDRLQNTGGAVMSSSGEMRNQRLQIAENHQKKQLPNGIDETLTRVYNGEYMAYRAQDRNQPATTHFFTDYCSDQRGIAFSTYISLPGGYRPVYHVPAPHGVHSSTAGQGYYRAVPVMYAVAPPSPEPARVLQPLYYPYNSAARCVEAGTAQVADNKAGATYTTVSSIALNR